MSNISKEFCWLNRMKINIDLSELTKRLKRREWLPRSRQSWSRRAFRRRRGAAQHCHRRRRRWAAASASGPPVQPLQPNKAKPKRRRVRERAQRKQSEALISLPFATTGRDAHAFLRRQCNSPRFERWPEAAQVGRQVVNPATRKCRRLLLSCLICCLPDNKGWRWRPLPLYDDLWSISLGKRCVPLPPQRP